MKKTVLVLPIVLTMLIGTACGGCYVFENVLVNEKGEAFVLKMN